MTSGLNDNGRSDELGGGPRSWSRTVTLILLCCGAAASLLATGGDGLIGTAVLEASFWVLVAGLAASALLFFWQAVRLLKEALKPRVQARAQAGVKPLSPFSSAGDEWISSA